MEKNILKKVMNEHKLDAIFSSSQQLRVWYTGINTSAGYLLITNDDAELIIDARYIEMAKRDAKNVKVSLYTKDTNAYLKSKNIKKIGLEQEYVTLKELENFKNIFEGAEFVNISSQNLRIIKSKDEVEKMEKAGAIALKALKDLEALIRPGISEMELDRNLDFLLKKHGASKSSFESIVVSGKNGSLPHGKPSSKILKDGELLTIDFGAVYKGYCSDITRTFHVGDVTNKKLLEIEKIVKEAHEIGIKSVKPGITTFEIDEICRNHIAKNGYGKYFVHSTGHGLGIDVHELPNVSKVKSSAVTLEPGMVITIEPGIYIPDFGGVRIEDDVLVTADGYRVLSKIV